MEDSEEGDSPPDVDPEEDKRSHMVDAEEGDSGPAADSEADTRSPVGVESEVGNSAPDVDSEEDKRSPVGDSKDEDTEEGEPAPAAGYQVEKDSHILVMDAEEDLNEATNPIKETEPSLDSDFDADVVDEDRSKLKIIEPSSGECSKDDYGEVEKEIFIIGANSPTKNIEGEYHDGDNQGTPVEEISNDPQIQDHHFVKESTSDTVAEDEGNITPASEGKLVDEIEDRTSTQDHEKYDNVAMKDSSSHTNEVIDDTPPNPLIAALDEIAGTAEDDEPYEDTEIEETSKNEDGTADNSGHSNDDGGQKPDSLSAYFPGENDE
uniref:Uncharacterized protein n=1 Tax=Pseudo-nitzschia australis TaxID=44445 RepID=A0A6V0AT67_9STRA